MTRFANLSLRWKLFGIILLTALLTLVSGLSFVFFNDVRTFRHDLVEGSTVIARTAADYSVAALAFGDENEAEKTLSKLAAVPNVDGAYLFDARGRLFASYQRKPGNKPSSPPSTGHFDRDGLVLVEPVTDQNERFGTIYLQVSTLPLERKIGRHVITMLLVMGVVLLIAIFLARRLESILSRPILDLTAIVRDISERHDYTIRVQKSANDEIGVLCDGFNDMLSQIERRQRERDEADQRTREKSQFLANMSHELRTPLNAIIGFSDVLLARLADRADPRERKFLENILSSGQHLLGLVNDILDLSKVEAGKMEMNAELFSIPLAIENVCTLMKGVSMRRNIQLSVSAGRDLPFLNADPVKIKQILYNLLSNAVKFSPDHSTVTVNARILEQGESPLGEHSIELSVADQGLGIDPQNHELIFHEFSQVDGTISRQFEGTGLGLALVRKLVEMHRGKVTVESALGKGSTFTVVLPLEAGDANLPEEIIAPALGRQTILVIEDETETYEKMARHLEANSYRAIHARSGEEGLHLARAYAPAAITLDLGLPGMDGWQVLKTLKSDPATSGLPVVIVSMMENRELGFAFGADDYLLKPVEPSSLLDSLSRLTGGSRSTMGPLLVIDDDRAFHELLEASLSPHGFQLDHAYVGEEGVALAGAPHSPSLVILDLMMEGMDGFEVAMRLKSDPRTAMLPILVMTARDLTGKDQQRLNGKVSALMQKHEGSTPNLVSVIRDLVGRQQRPEV